MLTVDLDAPKKKLTPTSLRAVLDADGNGVLSREEIANAANALRSLDKNQDGSLSKDELPAKLGTTK